MRLPTFLSLVLSSVIHSGASAQESAGTAADDLNAMPTPQASAMLLPPDLAGQIAGHKASPPSVMAPPPRRDGDVAQVDFHTTSILNAFGVCRRETYHTRAERAPPGSADAVFRRTSGPAGFIQVRLGPACDGVERGFATLQSSAISEGDASVMLLRLEGLRRDARAGRRLGVRVQCTTDYSYYTCPRRTNRLVADLPLEGAYLFSRSYDQRHELLLAATETTPGELFWEIRFTEHPEPVLHLRRRIPPPF